MYTHEIASRLASMGHEVILATSRPPGLPPRERIGGYTVVRRGGRLTVYPGGLFTYLSLRRAGFRPDIVVDEVNTIPFMTPLYAREPVAVLIHQLCMDCWGQALHPLLQKPGWALERLLHKVYTSAARRGKVRAVITVSESTAEDLKGLGYPSRLLYIVYNGVDPSRYPSNCGRVKEDLVSYVGRLASYKRVEDLLKAWSIVEERARARLIIAGRPEPGYLDRLRSLARRLGLTRVEVRGEVGEDEKLDILSRSRVLVYTSQREGWGRTVMEAAMCRTPTIAYDVPGLRDSVVHGRTGILVKPGDIGGLAEAIVGLLEDPEMAARMGGEARARALQYTWDSATERFLRILRVAIEEPS